MGKQRPLLLTLQRELGIEGSASVSSSDAGPWADPEHCQFSQDLVFFVSSRFLESHDYIRIHTSLFWVKKKYL